MSDRMQAVIVGLVVGAFFIWHGEWASRKVRATPACEAIGYTEGTVTVALETVCVTVEGGRRTYYKPEAARPGEVDG